MKVNMPSSTFILLLSIFSITYAAMLEHRGYHSPPPSSKYRGGPPMPPRPPSLPPYVKKWHMPPPHKSMHGTRYPHRRPHSAPPSGFPPKFGGSSGKGGGFIHPGLTLQMQHKQLQQQQMHQQLQQQGLLQAQYLPLQHKGISTGGLPPLPPITKPQSVKSEKLRPSQQSNIWNNYKPSHQKTNYDDIVKEKAPFLSSPQINNLEYDYHIQTNIIPNTQQPAHLIKQTDDNSGPIHTIPAPKLSLADKPKNMDIQSTYKDLDYQASYPKGHHRQLLKPNAIGHKYTHVTIQKAHQYQVTEDAPPEAGYHQQQQVGYGETVDPNVKEVQQYQQLESLPQAQFLVQQQDLGLQNQQLPSQDIFGVFNAVPQQPLLDVYTVPLGQHHVSFEATPTLPNYQSVVGLGSSHVVQPEFHSFNYQENEHNHQMQPKQIKHGQAPREIEIIYQQPQSSRDTTYQSYQPNKPYDLDFAQQFFAQHEETGPVQLDNSQEYSQSKEDAIANAFYSTLPNKEAADALASLQEAGKLNINAHVHQRSPGSSSSSSSNKKVQLLKKSSGVPMTIYVPDDFEDAEVRQKANISKKSVVQNEDYYENLSAERGEGVDVLDDMNGNKEFGERIKPKN